MGLVRRRFEAVRGNADIDLDSHDGKDAFSGTGDGEADDEDQLD